MKKKKKMNLGKKLFSHILEFRHLLCQQSPWGFNWHFYSADLYKFVFCGFGNKIMYKLLPAVTIASNLLTPPRVGHASFTMYSTGQQWRVKYQLLIAVNAEI